MAIPSQALKREGVETRRAAPKTRCYGEGIVQRTKPKVGGNESYSVTKILLPLAVPVQFRQPAPTSTLYLKRSVANDKLSRFSP